MSDEVIKPRFFEWEHTFTIGQLVPINGWWFRAVGIVREHGARGALVLEPTGERTGRPRLRPVQGGLIARDNG